MIVTGNVEKGDKGHRNRHYRRNWCTGKLSWAMAQTATYGEGQTVTQQQTMAIVCEGSCNNGVPGFFGTSWKRLQRTVLLVQLVPKGK